MFEKPPQLFLLVRPQVTNQLSDRVGVLREHLLHKATSLRREAGPHDPTVLCRPLSRHQSLLLQPVHHIGNVAAGHEQFTGELAQRERP